MATKKPKPGTARVSPLNTHLREMQAAAMKRAQAKKVWDTLQKQSANNDGRNTM